MPIYEFKCLKCGHVFELFKLKTDEPIEMKCPKCGGQEIERVMSRVGGIAIRGGDRSVKTTFHSCSSGSCATIEVPGPER